jgi:restriction endonuclease Mrr
MLAAIALPRKICRQICRQIFRQDLNPSLPFPARPQGRFSGVVPGTFWLLTAIGYGGSLADAGKAIGKSGDGGIDGVIKEDKLGLDLLFIQAKKWDNNTVGRPEIQKFVGALYGRKAKKGIFITTSTFSKEARDYAEGLDSRVILVDGAQLAELMFDHGIGVSTANSYVVKRVDSDFFEDDEVGTATAVEAVS